MLSADVDFKGNCPKCNAALHCCKQCSHFDTSTRFQCLKPIPVRIAAKDQNNECELFRPASPSPATLPPSERKRRPPSRVTPHPRRAPQSDARAAFDNLFKKTD